MVLVQSDEIVVIAGLCVVSVHVCGRFGERACTMSFQKNIY
jgi:hypothetical protein